MKERLRPAQALAVGLAAVGVAYLTLQFGRVPWISLALAVTFGFYGLIRKVAPVGALVGLALETLLMTGPAMAYLFFLNAEGRGAFLKMGAGVDLLLAASALVTALPLLLFTEGARRIHLSTVGILQYLAPSCTFILAIFIYGGTLFNGEALDLHPDLERPGPLLHRLHPGFSKNRSSGQPKRKTLWVTCGTR